MCTRVQRCGPARKRGIGIKTQQRVEPQEPVAVAAQPVQLLHQFPRFPGIQPVGNQQHQGTPADQPARVQAAQGGQRATELCAARKVFDGTAGMGQHLVGIGMAHGGRKVGQPGAERKHVTLAQALGGGMQKGQQQPCVTLHRSRHVHQHQQRQRLAATLQPGQAEQLAAGARRLVHHTGPGDAGAARTGPHAACGELGHGQANVARKPLHQPVFAARQRVEIRMLQACQVAGRHGRIEVHFLVGLWLLARAAKSLLRRQRLAHARAAFARFGLALGTGQHLRQQLVGQRRIAEIGVEQLAKDQPVLLAADHHGFERGAYILARCQPHRQRSLRRQRQTRAVHPHASTAQRTPKAAQVVGELAAACVT